MEYRVTWEIDVEADSVREAAEKAMRYQHADTTANVFYVEKQTRGTQRFGEPRDTKVDLGDVPRSALPGAPDTVTLDDVRALLSDLDAGKVQDLEEVARWCRTLLENAEDIQRETEETP